MSLLLNRPGAALLKKLASEVILYVFIGQATAILIAIIYNWIIFIYLKIASLRRGKKKKKKSI